MAGLFIPSSYILSVSFWFSSPAAGELIGRLVSSLAWPVFMYL